MAAVSGPNRTQRAAPFFHFRCRKRRPGDQAKELPPGIPHGVQTNLMGPRARGREGRRVDGWGATWAGLDSYALALKLIQVNDIRVIDMHPTI